MMFQIVDQVSDKLVNKLKTCITTSKSQEMRNWSQRYTGDNIGNVAFGIECDCKNL